MNSAEALHQFWSGFTWKAYDQSTVPSEEQNPAMPRITYEVGKAEFDVGIQLTASLWDRSYSWEAISKKADEIFDYIGLGGKVIPYDNGTSAIWIRRGVPFSQRMSDEDDSIRRIYIIVDVEFFTAK